MPESYPEIPSPNCEAFVQLGTRVTCDVLEAVSLIKQADDMYVFFCHNFLQITVTDLLHT